MVNAVLSLFTYGVAWAFVQPVIRWTGLQKVGLLRWLGLGIVPEVIFSFLFLDLSFYYWHRLNHQWPLLWRFHNVHHFDPDLDVTTAFRFHFGEVMLSSVFRGIQMLLIGVNLEVLAAFEISFQLATFFHHSNWKLPFRFEKALNRVFVGPRLHGIHHSQNQQETNSNYSVIFSCWDRWHGTLKETSPSQDITIGVAGYDTDADNQLKTALLSPLVPQRDYWLKALDAK